MGSYFPDDQIPSQKVLNLASHMALTSLFERMLVCIPDEALREQFSLEYKAIFEA